MLSKGVGKQKSLRVFQGAKANAKSSSISKADSVSLPFESGVTNA